jgi:hypothetical protein
MSNPSSAMKMPVCMIKLTFISKFISFLTKKCIKQVLTTVVSLTRLSSSVFYSIQSRNEVPIQVASCTTFIQIKQALGWEHAIRGFSKIATNIYLQPV